MTEPLSLHKPVISIVGPTASGKSSLAQNVAKRLGGAVISADSMQIYKGMDIGTAKLMPEEREVPHYLIDIVDPGYSYSAQQFQEQSRQLFYELDQKGIVPVLCGGTGFYVQAALEDMNFPKGDQDNNPVREFYTEYLDAHGAQALWEELNRVDSESANVIHPNNSKRVIRALEMYTEGVSYAQQSKNIKSLDEVVPSLRYGIQVDRELLNERINVRVDLMVEQGLVSEVETLLYQGFESALTAPQAIGYKEIVAALQGKCSLEEAIEQIKLATRRYAKRQRSWFNRDKKIKWLNSSKLSSDEMALVIERDYLSL
ncbi:MAG: tRNA (adenosine(37)-N6)-dimethylallyltransferase MiaA [Anaerotardibacter sp.]